MSKVHDLKCWPEPFKSIVSGIKRHEFRKDDRGFAVGDTLYLYEWDPTPTDNLCQRPRGRTGFFTVVRVTYVGRGFGIPEDYVCMSVVAAEEGPCPGLGLEAYEHYVRAAK